ncbi:MAG TPA: 4-(cytidine 5'-diphospho)-2-C-methyl-D-erythritol kinase [Chryseosolibacter sp.]
MVSFPHAKINLGLNVIRKRADGYHDLETCFYPIAWTDVLEIIPSKTFQFTSSGLAIEGNADTNLCVKAYQLLKKDFDLPAVHIHLHKIIPMGAGLGGGSSDAAFTLRQLSESFDLGLSKATLEDYAAKLGSDCAFFISDDAKLGTGRGEMLSPISVSLKGLYLVVVKPPVHVSTAEAYSGITPSQHPTNIQEVLERKAISEWRSLLINDFEDSVFKKYPAIREVKEQLYNLGALYASMSGSGSSVFGIFQSERNLADAFARMTYWQKQIE